MCPMDLHHLLSHQPWAGARAGIRELHSNVKLLVPLFILPRNPVDFEDGDLSTPMHLAQDTHPSSS